MLLSAPSTFLVESFPPVTAPQPFTLSDLYAAFPGVELQPTVQAVSAVEVPSPYQELLVHRHHMTVTVERFYGSRVNVSVLKSHQSGFTYTRQILLSLQSTGQVVQFGLVQIDLSVLAEAVRDEILSEKTPLGRVLIQHEVLRTVEPFGFFKVDAGPLLKQWFGSDLGSYGRLGIITADGKPAVKVAEILAPVPSSLTS